METNISGVTNQPTDIAQKQLALGTAMKNGINWFYWIAGLSLVNSIIYLAGGTTNFVGGLGITQLVDGIMFAIAEDFGANGGVIWRSVGFGFDLFIAAIFVGIGFLGQKRYRWIVGLGMLMYAVDGLIFVWVKEWFGVAFHAWALWGLWRGLQAINSLNTLENSLLPPSVISG